MSIYDEEVEAIRQGNLRDEFHTLTDDATFVKKIECLARAMRRTDVQPERNNH